MEEGNAVFERLAALVAQSGSLFVLHEHEATRTVADARRNLDFDVERIVKTVAFRRRDGRLVLAALRGVRRVAYPGLAALAGVNRRDLAALSAQEVVAHLGVEPGSVSPFSRLGEAALYIDADVLAIAPTLYCGAGRPDRTLEIAPGDLLRLTGGTVGDFSK
jgi:Cys-tRNA(Pro)/Cys-tRNA(Cys) deacylase